LPGIDDGVKTLAEAAALIEQFQALGYQKLITTPHIMMDYYRNTPCIIQERLEELQAYLKQEGINICIEAAAEYYMDEGLAEMIKRDDPLLTFGDRYVLVETAFINRPLNFWEMLFELQVLGYRPVLAHPERYAYLQKDLRLLDEIAQRGILLQVNQIALSGYYGSEAKRLAKYIIQKKMLSFVGSDCHGVRHMQAMQVTHKLKGFQKLAEQPLLNAQL
jgi:tyrosine-protein phosphatase YwqE